MQWSAVLFSLFLYSADACTPFNSVSPDLASSIGESSSNVQTNLEAQKALGENTKRGFPINIVQPGAIHSANELFCSDFDEKCRWKNMEGILIDELDWFQGIGYLESARLEIATGTRIVPDGYYAIAATEHQLMPTGRAILVSDPIQCQQGLAQLQFMYWTSPKVNLRVCTKKLSRLLPDYDECSGPIENGDPGPALIPISDQGNEAFQIYIIAENFIWKAIGMEGGFAVIDNIEYKGQMCNEDFENTQQEVLATENTDDYTAPPLPPLPDFFEDGKNFPKLIEKKNIANSAARQKYSYEELRANSDSQSLMESNDVSFVKQKPIPLHKSRYSGVHKVSNDIEDLDMIDEFSGNPVQAGVQTETRAMGIPTACDVLTCTFDTGECLKYIKNTPWAISNYPLGNPLTGIRGDATILPFNKNGSFGYLQGPKSISRLVTPAFELLHDVYFVFAYHKIDKKTRFRVYSKRADQHQEILLFEAPHTTKEARRWFREGKVLQRALYQYIAFEVRNLPPDHYVGLDEMMILNSQHSPICAQSKF